MAGHQLVLLCVRFIFLDSSFLFLSEHSLCFLSSHPLGLPTAVSGTVSQQSTSLSQRLLSRLFNCATYHVTLLLPNNNSLWVICSALLCSFQTWVSEEFHNDYTHRFSYLTGRDLTALAVYKSIIVSMVTYFCVR